MKVLDEYIASQARYKYFVGGGASHQNIEALRNSS